MTRVPLVDLGAQEAAALPEVLAAVASVAREAQFVLGARVEAFEQWFAGASGTRHAVGVASGSDALELSLLAVGVGPGDAVVTPALSFIAAAEAIANVGARPVFCDVDPATSNLTRGTCEAALVRARRAGLRVRAIVPVHLFGRCAPLEPLVDLAASEDLAVVEDAAQAFGARGDGGAAPGSLGTAGCFSFFPTKNLGAWGDGGAVVTSQEHVAARVRRLRSHGACGPYVHEELGRNSRLDALQAAVLLAKARHLEGWQRSRARVAARYRAELEGLPIRLPVDAEPPGVHAWHAFVVQCERRDDLAEWLRRAGVETRVYYPVPLHRQPCFSHLAEPPLPEAEAICRAALALPMFAAMTDAQQDHVVAHVRRFFEERWNR